MRCGAVADVNIGVLTQQASVCPAIVRSQKGTADLPSCTIVAYSARFDPLYHFLTDVTANLPILAIARWNGGKRSIWQMSSQSPDN